MQFQVRYDSDEAARKIKGFLDGIADLVDKSGGLTFSRSSAGKIGVQLFVLDTLVDEFAERNKTESAWELFAAYFYAKALLYAYAGRSGDGRQYWTKARGKRVNGRFAELCQSHYPA